MYNVQWSHGTFASLTVLISGGSVVELVEHRHVKLEVRGSNLRQTATFDLSARDESPSEHT